MQPTRTFRIFVSSTFSDLKSERNALHERVFPSLEALCAEHEARFQAIDLRWGVREEAGLDQQTMKICLGEVKRCQAITPKPNFLILLGERYGWRPLPAEIPADERRLVEEGLRSRGAEGEADLERLRRWYEHDLNARPHSDPPGMWLLRPRTAEEWGTDEYEDYATWEREVERPLRESLVDVTRGLDLSDEARLKYGASATHQEIEHGALSVDDAHEHVFCFFRTIDGLPDDASAAGFRDLAPADPEDPESERVPDADADDRLADLKTKLKAKLPEEHIVRYGATWIGREDENPDVEDDGPVPVRIDDLDRLCGEVERLLSEVIRAEIERLDRERGEARRTEIDEEIATHEAFARERLGSKKDPERTIFVGRETPLRRIAEYLGRRAERPLALVGEPGSGKSSVMARAFEDARDAYGASPEKARDGLGNAHVICRFIGWTPGSAVIRELLDSLCRQIARLYGEEEDTPSEYRELVQEFPKRLALASADRPLILFLDALDQLTDADNARNLIWLPTRLPDHVHLVVSTSTEPEEVRQVLERRLPGGTLLLDDMPVEEANALLGAWLDDVDRTLTGGAGGFRDARGDRAAGGQRRYVLERYDQPQNRRPLYLKLAFEEARRWRSFDPVEDAPEAAGATRVARLSPAGTVGLIDQLFDRLASPENHGETMVSRSLAYLVAARNGLTEEEEIALLSRDPQMLDEVMKFHRPPEEELPVVIWSRFYFDLEPYLTERSADGARLLAFYHRQLEEVARRKYLGPIAEGARRTLERHRALAEYFGDDEAQPLFRGQIANLRRLSELPYQLTYAADPENADDPMWERLYATLTDFEFLEAKCTYVAVTTLTSGEEVRKVYGGVYELQEDYRRALEVFPTDQ